MKQLTALQRRSNSFRNAGDTASDGAAKSNPTLFWLVIHGLCCLISLVLGFRFSRLVFFLLFSPYSTTIYTTSSIQTSTETAADLLNHPARNATASRVVVGRHGILIRPWPHPDPKEVMKAHSIIDRVQKEQRAQFGFKNPRTVIAVTPTYVRTFQALHLTGVMHTLMNLEFDVVWVVVEANGVSNETASILAKSGLRVVHVGLEGKMPVSWEDRHRFESRMRIRGLREIREQKLDGIVVFMDDSNMHTLQLFDEIQSVRWIGAVSVGILAHFGGLNEPEPANIERDNIDIEEEKDGKKSQVPVQGPACNSSNHLVGFHTFNTAPFVGQSARYIGDGGVVLPRKFEWCGFVLNSRLVWADAMDRPTWARDFDEVERDGGDYVEGPLSLVKETSAVEPLGGCGRKVMLWWLRIEARADSKFPPRWIIDPPLEVTVPAKRTPWPDAPPELSMASASDKKVATVQETAERRVSAKTGSRKKRNSRGKKKRTSNRVAVQHGDVK